jgi:hypothetical protein
MMGEGIRPGNDLLDQGWGPLLSKVGVLKIPRLMCAMRPAWP